MGRGRVTSTPVGRKNGRQIDEFIVVMFSFVRHIILYNGRFRAETHFCTLSRIVYFVSSLTLNGLPPNTNRRVCSYRISGLLIIVLNCCFSVLTWTFINNLYITPVSNYHACYLYISCTKVPFFLSPQRVCIEIIIVTIWNWDASLYKVT